MDEMQVGCGCGQVRLVVLGADITSPECYCGSCRDAAGRMATLPGAPAVANADGGTAYVCYRKDRVRIEAGQGLLAAFRLKPEAPTRRVIATCCNTPVFAEFQGGHWLSLYAGLWPDGTAPRPALRTQTGGLPEGVVLDGSVPAGGWATAKFYGQLLAAWIAMGFKVPKVEVAGPELVLPGRGGTQTTV